MRTSFLLMIVVCCVVASCSKKHTPQTSAGAVDPSSPGNSPAATEKKIAVRRKVKIAVPKVISVDDRAAHRVADGRLYYDLEGRRYWKNYKDGKYYIFNKSMYNDPAFTPPR